MARPITVRRPHFAIPAAAVAQTVEDDPVAAAFYAALSATFPEGERFFVRSVQHFAAELTGDLKADVIAFVRQEAQHSREHALFNGEVGAAGLPIAALTARADAQLAIVGARAPIDRLATTLALEHFTAVFAHRLLAEPRHLAFADAGTRALWRWHAVEEIEHKAVAYDVFLHATARWSGLRRYLCRTGAMLDAMGRLAGVVWGNVAAVLAAAGAAAPGWRRRVIAYALFRPGVLGAMTVDLLRFFAPGFHPDHCDDAAVVSGARAELETQAA